MTIEAEEQVTSAYAVRVGDRLRSLRKQNRLSLQAVESGSAQEFKASVLGAYERGERAISVPRLQRLAQFYNVPVDRLLPGDVGADLGYSTGEADPQVDIDLEAEATKEDRCPGKMVINLVAVEASDAPEKDLLRRYCGMIQVQRRDFNGRVLTIRSEDVRVLALMLEATPMSLQRRLDDLGLTL